MAGPRVAAIGFLWLGVLAGTPAAAQVAAADPPGPYVIDVRGVTSAIPQDAGFFPSIPTATIIPSRGYGIDVGAHLYVMRLGSGRLGIGVNMVRVRGTASPAAPSSGSTPGTPAPATRPDVRAVLTTLVPQLSYNFGSSEGWSYVSAGLGRAQLTTGTSAFGETGSDAGGTPARSAVSGTRSSINIGGGARWFTRAHLAFSFDVRFHLISSGSAKGATQATPRATLVAASAGISLR